MFYQKVQDYINLRPKDYVCDRFFIQYRLGKCVKQPIGRHKIAEVPERIAGYLNLKNKHRYTGHCFRRSSATLLSESGANMQMIKQLGRWRSDIIAQGYIENSLHNRQMIFDGITHNAGDSNVQKKVSVKRKSPQEPAHDLNPNDFNLHDSDFLDDFTISDFVPTTSKKKKIIQ